MSSVTTSAVKPFFFARARTESVISFVRGLLDACVSAGEPAEGGKTGPVELVPAEAVPACLCNGFHGARARGAHDQRHLGFGRAPRGRELAIWVNNPLHADGTE